MVRDENRTQICCWIPNRLYDKIRPLIRLRGKAADPDQKYEFTTVSDYISSLIEADVRKRESDKETLDMFQKALKSKIENDIDPEYEKFKGYMSKFYEQMKLFKDDKK